MNLEHVAKLSGVSRSTVSRVINDDPRVHEETRRRVKEVIQRLNYQPNAVARSLAGGRTNILGLVIPMGVNRLFSDPYFPLLVQGVSSVCNAREYSVMLWVAEPEYERRTIRQILNNKLIDGVIIASSLVDDPLVQALSESNLPFVLIGRHPNLQVNYVDVDNQTSAMEVVAYLVRLGYHRIATITGPQNMIAGADRLEGYKSGLRQLGVTLDPSLVVEGDFTEDGGYVAMQRLLPRQPDVVFAASDSMAMGALRAVRENGLRVPEDIALVGFDDMPFAARTEPPLTTVRQPVQRTGGVAAETLIDILEQPASSPHRIILPTELVIRASCGPTTR